MSTCNTARPGQATPMSFRSLLVAFMLFITGSVFCQGIYSVNIAPNPATSASPAMLLIDGWMPNPCWSIAGVTATWAGNTVNIYIDFTPSSQTCPSVITSFNQNVQLSTLAAGTYTARIWNKDSNSIMFTYNFSVASGGPGGSCSNPVVIQCGGTYTGNNATNGSSNFSSYTINGVTSTGLSGPEVIHRFTLSQTSTIELILKNLSKDLDLFLMSQCGNILGLFKSENSGIQNELITATLNAGTYTVIVDGYQGAISNYFLGLTCQSITSSCGTPGGLQSNYITQYTAFLTWNAVSGAQNYTVEYRPTNGIWTPLTTTSNIYFNLGSTGPTLSLAAGANYQWRVRANCPNNQTGAWATASFTTLPGNCTGVAASQFSVSAVTSTSAVVTCSATAPNFRFRYRKAGIDTGWNLQINPSSSNSKTYTSLLPCTTYEVQCQLGCPGGGVSGYSTSFYFTTTGCANTCAAPVVSQLFVTNITATSATLNCAAFGTNWDWAYRVVGATEWINLPSTTTNNTTVNGLSLGIIYEFTATVRCSNGVWSAWTLGPTFATLPSVGTSNNEPCGATVITPTTSCAYQSLSTIGATASTVPPSPIFNGCSTVNMKDIWVKIPMPSTGKILVNTTAGTQNNIVVTAYSGTSCGALTAFGCIDNNVNGDNMPDFTVTSSSQYVWLRIWGYNGATGTFNICVKTVSGFAGNNDEGLTENETEVAERSQETGSSTAAMKVYPVPATSILNIEMPLADDVQANVSIYDQNGRLVLEQSDIPTTGAGIHETLDISALPEGNYILRVSTDQSVQSALFMKVK